MLLPSLLLSLPFAFFAFDASSSDDPLVNEAVEKFIEEENKYYESLGRKGGEKCDVYYDPQNGKCAWWNSGKKRYERPALEYASWDKISCLHDLHSHIFTHVCGDQLYEQIKYCAKVKFFNNVDPQKGGAVERREDILLLLIDGCISCIRDTSNDDMDGDDPPISVIMKISYTMPEGSFFSACSEQTLENDLFSTSFPYNASITTAKVAEAELPKITDNEIIIGPLIGQRSFAIPILLVGRQCRGMFSEDAPIGGFGDVKLTVEHNCTADKTNQQIDQQLTKWLQINAFKHNVAELRRVHVDLGAHRVGQFSGQTGKYEYNAEKQTMEFENLEVEKDDGF
ncbi:hypothetical protein niasHT_006902 [Heterodera trifolii]|uniref:Effector protein n=1 Tax=Heterodera trifolii TaxID=157864 RepID=A0ABD2LP73_9BILA